MLWFVQYRYHQLWFDLIIVQYINRYHYMGGAVYGSFGWYCHQSYVVGVTFTDIYSDTCQYCSTWCQHIYRKGNHPISAIFRPVYVVNYIRLISNSKSHVRIHAPELMIVPSGKIVCKLIGHIFNTVHYCLLSSEDALHHPRN